MIERRKFKRYPMPRGTFAILRNELDQLHNHRRMSIGEIAMVLYKSKTEVMGQVTNMSFGGIAFESSSCKVPTTGYVELDLLMTEHGIYLHNIPFAAVPIRSIRAKRRKTAGSPRAALRFKKLDSTLKKQLRELMAYHIG
jgi:hypothetical protein